MSQVHRRSWQADFFLTFVRNLNFNKFTDSYRKGYGYGWRSNEYQHTLDLKIFSIANYFEKKIRKWNVETVMN